MYHSWISSFFFQIQNLLISLNSLVKNYFKSGFRVSITTRITPYSPNRRTIMLHYRLILTSVISIWTVMTVNKVLDLWSLTISKDTNIDILFVSLEGYHLNWRKSKHKNGFSLFWKNSNSERIWQYRVCFLQCVTIEF